MAYNIKRILFSLLVVFIAQFSFCVISVFAQTPDYWPTEEWRTSTPEEQGMHSSILADMMERIQGSYQIDSVLVVRNGYVVLDAYFWPFSKGQKHIIHSCTKSVMSALIGIAIDKGYIKNVNQPVMEFFPDRTLSNLNALKQSITLENLLTMTSGLKCRDSYLYSWAGLSEMTTSNDWAQYVLDLPMAKAPGEKFEYCNGVSHLLSVIIQNMTKMKTSDFARKHLFEPLGIADVGWTINSQGIDVGYGHMWLKPQDMAKIGWLYLNKGRWGNKQIVSSTWVEASTRGHIDATLYDQYGYQWWIDSAGFYMAVGYKGQFIFVIPEKNIVAVFTSDLPSRYFPAPRKFLNEYVIPAAASFKPLHSNPDEKARLDALLDGVALASTHEFIWTSKEEGAAKDGVFKRTISPGFKFEYPSISRKAPRHDLSQVMRMEVPGGGSFSASVSDIPEGMKLKDFGPKSYTRFIERFGTDIRVVSNEEIKLKCGTIAYKTYIKWIWNQALELSSTVVSAFKDDKCVFLEIRAMTWKHKKLASIAESLTFK